MARKCVADSNGTTPLAGAWRSGEPDNPWLYVVTAGHYGVMSTNADRPRRPAHGDEFSDSEVLAPWEGFGINAGARLETGRSFDHWPMLGNLAGYEVRKHETFVIDSVEHDRFTAILPLTKKAKSGAGSTKKLCSAKCWSGYLTRWLDRPSCRFVRSNRVLCSPGVFCSRQRPARSSSRPSNRVVVDQLLIVMLWYSGVPTIRLSRLCVRRALRRAK